jgi:hypothetical protein
MNPVYKIRDKKTGLFSTGGTTPRWTARGKSWTGAGPLKLHLRQYLDVNSFQNTRIPESWEIVVFALIEDRGFAAKDFEEGLLEAKRKKEERHQARKAQCCNACGR